MENELRPALIQNPSDDLMNEFVTGTNLNDVIFYVYRDLTPREKLVFEYLTGNGKKKKSVRQIAVAMRIPENQVNTIKRSIVKKFKDVQK